MCKMANIEKRTSKNGKITYRAKIRLKGFPSESATFDRLTDAKRWIQSTESSMKEGRYFKTSESKKHNLSDLIDRYIRDVLPRKPKSQKTQTTQLKRWKQEIGETSLDRVSTALIIEVRDRLQNENICKTKEKYRSVATLNRYMSALSHAFTIAIKEWCWLEDNPCLKIDNLKEPRGRIRFLSDEERRRLLKECQNSDSKHLYKIVVLALSTGARKNEILKIKWQDLNLERGMVTFFDTKNKEIRSLPIRGLSLEILKEHSKNANHKCPYIFTSNNICKPIDIRSAWEAALKRADIDDFKFHDLRHSAASYLAMNGASLAEIAEVLGHKTLQMVKRYAHLSEAHTASVVEKMNNKIFG